MTKVHTEIFENREQVIAYLLSQEAQKPGNRIVWKDGYKPIHTVVSGNHVRRFMPPPTQEEIRDRQEGNEMKRIKDELVALYMPAPKEEQEYFPKTLEELESLSFVEKLLLAGWIEVPPDPHHVAIFGENHNEKDRALYNDLFAQMKRNIALKEGKSAGEKFIEFIEVLFQLIIALFLPGEVNSDQPAPKPA